MLTMQTVLDETWGGFFESVLSTTASNEEDYLAWQAEADTQAWEDREAYGIMW